MSRRHGASLAVLLAASLSGAARAQTMPHPCDDRTSWPSGRAVEALPVSSPEGLFYAASFDFLTLQSDKVKAIPAVARYFNAHGVDPDAVPARESVDKADQESVAAPDQETFTRYDAVLSRAYLGAARVSLAQGRWMSPAEKAGKPGAETTVKQAREALTLVCDKFDTRRQAYARKLRESADFSAAAREAALPKYHVTEAAAEKVAKAEERSAVKAPDLAPGVAPNDPRLQSSECLHLCEALLAFGPEGCFPGMPADEKKWCEQKSAAVAANSCACR